MMQNIFSNQTGLDHMLTNIAVIRLRI